MLIKTLSRTLQLLYFLKLKFPVSSHLLRLYSSVCVGTVRKQHCWFSHEAAHVYSLLSLLISEISFFFFLLISINRKLYTGNCIVTKKVLSGLNVVIKDIAESSN